MKKLSTATVDTLVRSNFSIIPRTTSEPCPNSTYDISISFPQYGPA